MSFLSAEDKWAVSTLSRLRIWKIHQLIHIQYQTRENLIIHTMMWENKYLIAWISESEDCVVPAVIQMHVSFHWNALMLIKVVWYALSKKKKKIVSCLQCYTKAHAWYNYEVLNLCLLHSVFFNTVLVLPDSLLKQR